MKKSLVLFLLLISISISGCVKQSKTPVSTIVNTTTIPIGLKSTLYTPTGYGVNCNRENGKCILKVERHEANIGYSPVVQEIIYSNFEDHDLKDLKFQQVCYRIIEGWTPADISNKINYYISDHTDRIILDKPKETNEAREVYFFPKYGYVKYKLEIDPTIILGRLVENNDIIKVKCYVQFYSTSTPVIVKDNFEYEISILVTGEDALTTTTTIENIKSSICGDGLCELGENNQNCCNDCGCGESQACDMESNKCVNGISYSNGNVRLECPYCTGDELKEYCKTWIGECKTSLYDAFNTLLNIYSNNAEFFDSTPKEQLVVEVLPKKTTFAGSIGVAEIHYLNPQYPKLATDYSMAIITYNFPALMHEITHWFTGYIMNSRLWFDEGLADYKEGLYQGNIYYGIGGSPPVGCSIKEYYSLLKEGKDIFQMRPFLKDAHYVGNFFFIGLIEDYNCDYNCMKKMVNYLVVKYSKDKKSMDKNDIKEATEIATGQKLDWLFNSLSPGIEYNRYYSPMPEPSNDRTC
jgi:hypothetical protein